MSFNGYSQQQLDALSVGRTPSFFPVVFKYAPTANFINFPIGQFWVDTATQVLYYLESFSNASGITQATWIPISAESVLITLSDTGNTPVMPSSSISSPANNIQLISGNSSLTIVSDPGSNLITFTNVGAGSQTLTGNDTVAVSPSGGTIQTLGNTVSNSTYGQALWTNNPSGNIEQWNIQVAAAIGSGNVAKAGIAAFNSAQFTTNTTTGFVSLIGSSTSPPLIGLTPDATSGLGTSPVIADGSGNIKITSASISNTGSYSTGLQTLSNSVNQLAIQMQWAGSNAAVSTANNFGIAQFDSNMFTVSSGFVQIKNGGATGAVTKIQGDDSQAVVPASGLITFTGVVVNNGANAHGPVTFLKNNTSIEELDVQVASASGSSSKTNAGLASFNSAQFSVDANGYVSATGGGGGSLSTLTANSGSNPVSPMSGNINVYGVGSLTTVGSANTVTVELTGLTQYNVLLGQGTTTIGLAAPGVSGTVLASNGTSAYPTFQTLGSLGATTQYTLDEATTPIFPNSSGVIVLTGGQVASGTIGTNVIQTMGNAANSCAIQIQRSTKSPVSNGALNGVSHYNSANFNVDNNGFVSTIPSAVSQPGVTNLGISYSAGVFSVCAANGTALSVSNPGYIIMQSKVTPGTFVTYTITANQTFQDSAGTNTIAGNSFGVTCLSGRAWDQDMPFYIYAVSNSSAGSPETAVNFMISRLPQVTFSPLSAKIGKTGSAVASTQGSFFALSNPTIADYASSAAMCIGAFRMRSTTNIASWTVQTLQNGSASVSGGNTTQIMADGIGEFHEGTKFWHPLGTMGNLSNSLFSQTGAATYTPSILPLSYSLNKSGVLNIYASIPPNNSGTGTNQLRYNAVFIPAQSTAGPAVINGLIGVSNPNDGIAYINFITTNSSTAFAQNQDLVANKFAQFSAIYVPQFL